MAKYFPSHCRYAIVMDPHGALPNSTVIPTFQMWKLRHTETEEFAQGCISGRRWSWIWTRQPSFKAYLPCVCQECTGGPAQLPAAIVVAQTCSSCLCCCQRSKGSLCRPRRPTLPGHPLPKVKEPCRPQLWPGQLTYIYSLKTTSPSLSPIRVSPLETMRKMGAEERTDPFKESP